MKHKSIICPFCQHKYSDDDMYRGQSDLYAIAPNEEKISELCPICLKEFWIQGGYVPEYETFKTEDECE